MGSGLLKLFYRMLRTFHIPFLAEKVTLPHISDIANAAPPPPPPFTPLFSEANMTTIQIQKCIFFEIFERKKKEMIYLLQEISGNID